MLETCSPVQVTLYREQDQQSCHGHGRIRVVKLNGTSVVVSQSNHATVRYDGTKNADPLP